MNQTQRIRWAEQQPSRPPEPPILEALFCIGLLLIVIFLLELCGR